MEHKGLDREIAVGDHHRPHSEVDIPPLKLYPLHTHGCNIGTNIFMYS